MVNTPTSGGHKALASIVTSKLDTFTVTRPSHSTGAMGGSESETTFNVDIFVGSPNEIATDTEYGERLTGSLAGLALPSADIQEGDRVTYQGVPYEVQETITSDDDTGDVLQAINFVRRANDS